MKLTILLSIFLILFTSCRGIATPSQISTASTAQPTIPAPPITDMLLPIDTHSDPRTESVSHIMIHFMSLVTIQPDDPYNMQGIRQLFCDSEISTHFIIDREGTIHRLIPEERVAWHAGKGVWGDDDRYTDKMNAYSIGIELLGMGTFKEMQGYLTQEQYNQLDSRLLGFTSAQYASLNELVKYLCARFPDIRKDRQHILGHSEYSERKTDPGTLFDWSQLSL